MYERKIGGGGLSFFQELFHMCFITIRHQGNGKIWLQYKVHFNTHHESLLTGDHSDIDQCLICFSVVAMLFCASLNMFFSHLTFFKITESFQV